MGYLYLFTAVAFGLTKGYLGKRISDKTPTVKNSITTNLIRMVFCIVVGLIFALCEGGLGGLVPETSVLLVALGAGVATCAFIVSWLLSVRESAYMSVEAFIAMGVLVPTICSAIFYGESVGTSQIIGLTLLLVAVVVMSAYSGQVKKGFSIKSILLLTFTGLSAGLTDFLQKVYVNTAHVTGASAFNLYVYVFSAVILGVVSLLLKGERSDGPRGMLADRKKVVFIAIMAVCLFCNSFFKTLAAGLLDAVLLYPLSQGSALILSLVMSTALFKEKLKPTCIAGMCIMFLGLIFINVIKF